MRIEQLDELGEISERPGQSIDLVYDHHVDAPSTPSRERDSALGATAPILELDARQSERRCVWGAPNQ